MRRTTSTPKILFIQNQVNRYKTDIYPPEYLNRKYTISNNRLNVHAHSTTFCFCINIQHSTRTRNITAIWLYTKCFSFSIYAPSSKALQHDGEESRNNSECHWKEKWFLYSNWKHLLFFCSKKIRFFFLYFCFSTTHFVSFQYVKLVKSLCYSDIKIRFLFFLSFLFIYSCHKTVCLVRYGCGCVLAVWIQASVENKKKKIPSIKLNSILCIKLNGIVLNAREPGIYNSYCYELTIYSVECIRISTVLWQRSINLMTVA